MILRLLVAILAVSSSLMVDTSPSFAAARACTIFRAGGNGPTETYAHWRATRIVTQSAKRWAGNRPHSRSPVDMHCESCRPSEPICFCRVKIRACRG